MRAEQQFNLSGETVRAHHTVGRDTVWLRYLRFADEWYDVGDSTGVTVTATRLKEIAKDLNDMADFIEQHQCASDAESST